MSGGFFPGGLEPPGATCGPCRAGYTGSSIARSRLNGTSRTFSCFRPYVSSSLLPDCGVSPCGAGTSGFSEGLPRGWQGDTGQNDEGEDVVGPCRKGEIVDCRAPRERSARRPCSLPRRPAVVTARATHRRRVQAASMCHYPALEAGKRKRPRRTDGDHVGPALKPGSPSVVKRRELVRGSRDADPELVRSHPGGAVAKRPPDTAWQSLRTKCSGLVKG
jgi:hypothetical protein